MMGKKHHKRLFNKYKIKKNGGPTDPNAEYFVLRLDTDPVARKAMLAYADGMEEDSDIYFANQIREWVRRVIADLSNETTPPDKDD